MGKRKFRMSHRKNFERKRYQAAREKALTSRLAGPSIPEQSDMLSLVVSFPIDSFLNTSVSDCEVLLKKLWQLKNLPNGWAVEGDSIARAMFSITKSLSYGSVVITISRGCHWMITINNQKVLLPNNTLLQFHEDVLDTCDKVLMLLTEVDCCRLCIGNTDDKFDFIRDKRKGKFVDRLGTSIDTILIIE